MGAEAGPGHDPVGLRDRQRGHLRGQSSSLLSSYLCLILCFLLTFSISVLVYYILSFSSSLSPLFSVSLPFLKNVVVPTDLNIKYIYR